MSSPNAWWNTNHVFWLIPRTTGLNFLADNRYEGLKNSSVFPWKKGRPQKDTKPPGCEIVSSSTFGVGAYGLTRLSQNENCKTNTNIMHEETMGGKPDVFISLTSIFIWFLWTKFTNPCLIFRFGISQYFQIIFLWNILMKYCINL